MNIPFYKYQGTGNDFIIIDNRLKQFPKKDILLINKMCDRKFGVGADGLILIENHKKADFNMVYYNSDGNLSSMCGNGGRCLVHFARFLGIISESATFEAIDGMHEATINDDMVSLKMNDVDTVLVEEDRVFLNTGSPHDIRLVDDVNTVDVQKLGAKIRHEVYGKKGSNVNFVEQLKEDVFLVRTYERGVEGETLSCGTGVTAVALAMYESKKTVSKGVILQTQGGNLKVTFEKDDSKFTNIYLIGPTEQVYKGVWEL